MKQRITFRSSRGRGRAGGLSGTYDAKLRGHAHRRAEAEFRLAARNAERAYAAGFPAGSASATLRAGGLAYEAISAAAHADYLLRNCWKAALTFPRCGCARAPANSSRHAHQRRELAQLVCALRIMFPGRGHCALDARIGEAARRAVPLA